MSEGEMNREAVIPGRCEASNPESRDSGSGPSDHPGMTEKKRGIVRVAAALSVVILCLTVAFTAWVASLGPLPLTEARQVSTTIVDRNGKLLRAYAMADGRWRLPVDANKDVDPTYLKLLFAYEDQRFRNHHGVDPRALARAAFQLATRGHIVSGGST